jgi:hypothetical protein
MSNVRVLVRLIDRLEEFLDEYKTVLEVDEASTLDDAISVIDRIKSELEAEEDQDED